MLKPIELTDLEKAILVIMLGWGEYWRRYSTLMAELDEMEIQESYSIKDVREAMKSLEEKKAVYYSTTWDIDGDMKLNGRGYFIESLAQHYLEEQLS